MSRKLNLTKIGLFALAILTAFAVFSAPTPAAAQGPRGGNIQAGRQILEVAIKIVTDATGLARVDLLKQLTEGKTLNDIITAAGKDPKTIQADVLKALTDEINKAVTDGKLQKAAADRLLENLSANVERAMSTKVSDVVDRIGQAGQATVLQGAVSLALIEETARAGSLTAREVVQLLRDGKSLNDVIKDKGLDAAKITAAATQTVTDEVNARVKEGKLTEEQAKTALADLAKLITDTLARTDLGTLGGALGDGLGGRPGGRGLPGKR